MQLRAVAAARVSHVQGSEKTSHLTQAEGTLAHCDRHKFVLVDMVEDLNISAIKKGPWERPDLEPWLTDRVHEFDVLVLTKIDRLLRRADDATDLRRWAETHRKRIDLVDDSITLDYHTPEAERDWAEFNRALDFFRFLAMYAEIEGRRYVERARDRVDFLKHTDRWAYGLSPYGFRVCDHPGGRGKALEHDPEAQRVLHLMATWLLDERDPCSVNEIVRRLIAGSELSPRDLARVRRGEPAEGEQWSRRRVQMILQSPATQGLKVSKGAALLDEEGRPIRVGPPSFDEMTWEAIQSRLQERARQPRGSRVHSTNPLLGVAKCGLCGKNLTRRAHTKSSRAGAYRYYACSHSISPCPGISARSDVLEASVERAFLDECRALPVVKRVYVIGETHADELARTEKIIDSLRSQNLLGLFLGEKDQALYQRQMTALIGRREELAAKESRPSGWHLEPTGQTYGEAWGKTDELARRRMLLDAGVTAIVSRSGGIHVDVPSDIKDRMAQAQKKAR